MADFSKISQYLYIGASTDTKPTAIEIGARCYAYDTKIWYITNDGTNWREMQDLDAVTLAAETTKIIGTVNIASSQTLAAVTAITNALPAGTNRIGQVSGTAVEVRVAKAIDASVGAYAARDVVNDDDCCTTATYWTFTNMVRAVGEYGLIVSATLFNETCNVSPRLTLYLYNAAPTGELMDNSKSNAPYPADRTKYIGSIHFPALSAKSTATASVAQATPSTTGGLPLGFKCATGDTSIYGILVTEDIFTQVATDDIEITLFVDQY